MRKYRLPIINQQVETVILANGAFPQHLIPLSILHNCKYLVCCDGAIDKLYETGRRPDAIVGDCDSLSDQNKVRFASIIHRIAEQDTNDLTKAVNFCTQQGLKNIVILGATGEREDHTIGNISLLSEYMADANVKMVSDYGVFVAVNTNSEFESTAGQKVSIFCIDSCHITSHGLAYAINNQIFANWWQATLNEAIANSFSLCTEGRIIVYRAFAK